MVLKKNPMTPYLVVFDPHINSYSGIKVRSDDSDDESMTIEE